MLVIGDLYCYDIIVLFAIQYKSKIPLPRFSDVFPQNSLEFLVQILHVYYMFLSTLGDKFQLSPTVTKLCHIKCDHPACVLADGGHFVHMM